MVKLRAPLNEKKILKLKIGDKVSLSGTIYTARDKTHQRLTRILAGGGRLPFDLEGQVIYYAGPTSGRKGKAIGSIGPTTSARMDPYTPLLLKNGVRGTIGKGERSVEVREALRDNKAVYFIAFGGAAAFLARYVKEAKILAYQDLGSEAIYELEVEEFPLVVAIDSKGRSIFEEGIKKYSRKSDIR